MRYLMLTVVVLAGCNPSGCSLHPKPDIVTDPRGTAPKDYFAVRFEQYGKAIQVRGNEVTLDKGAFSVMVALKHLGGVFVNASFDAKLHDLARAGGALDAAIPFEAADGVPAKTLLVSDNAFDHWYAVSPRIHTFDDVKEVKHGNSLIFVLCRKDLARFRDARGGRDLDLRKITGRQLYLVFVYTEWDAGRRRVERERKFVKVNFR